MTQDEQQELSARASVRRDKMLPLLQQAMRERSRRKRRNKATAFSLLALLLVGVLMERFSTTEERFEELDRVVDAQSTGTEHLVERPAIRSETESPATASPDFKTTMSELAMKGADFQTIESEELYARAIQRDPNMIIESGPMLAVEIEFLPDRVAIEYITTEELISDLSEEGFSSAVACEASSCTLHITPRRENTQKTPPRALEETGQAHSRHVVSDFLIDGFWPRDGSISMENGSRLEKGLNPFLHAFDSGTIARTNMTLRRMLSEGTCHGRTTKHDTT